MPTLCTEWNQRNKTNFDQVDQQRIPKIYETPNANQLKLHHQLISASNLWCHQDEITHGPQSSDLVCKMTERIINANTTISKPKISYFSADDIDSLLLFVLVCIQVTAWDIQYEKVQNV